MFLNSEPGSGPASAFNSTCRSLRRSINAPGIVIAEKAADLIRGGEPLAAMNV
jgi:hypothetical protein